MKRVAIVQSNYIPWKGYFDMIGLADEFILFDDVQYTKRDWRNRNRIKTAQGTKWLTIPVHVKGRYEQLINEVEVSDASWPETHWKTLRMAYAQAPYFGEFRERYEDLYLGMRKTRLSAINRSFLEAICADLRIEPNLTWSSDYPGVGAKTERLLSICIAAGADRYLAGPRSRDYLDESLFTGAGIEVEWMGYSGYPEYPQVHPPFEHRVTVLDLLFHTGADAHRFLKSPTGRHAP
jgi:hypothetical protein